MTSLLMTFINMLRVAKWKSDNRLSGHAGGEICHYKLLNYLYVTLMWWHRTDRSPTCEFGDGCSHTRGSEFISNSTSSRWDMNYEPLVWEHQSPKCYGGEPIVISHPWLRTTLERKCSFATRVKTECSHIRVWEHPGQLCLINELYQPMRNVF